MKELYSCQKALCLCIFIKKNFKNLSKNIQKMFDLQNILKMRFSKITAGNPVVLTTVNFPSNLAFRYS